MFLLLVHSPFPDCRMWNILNSLSLLPWLGGAMASGLGICVEVTSLVNRVTGHDFLCVAVKDLFLIITACFLVYFWSGLTAFLTTLGSRTYKKLWTLNQAAIQYFFGLNIIVFTPPPSSLGRRERKVLERGKYVMCKCWFARRIGLFASELKLSSYSPYPYRIHWSNLMWPVFLGKGTKYKVVILNLLPSYICARIFDSCFYSEII